MKTTVDFLDAVKKKHGFTSDYQLAIALNITRSSVSKFRVGKDCLGDETACKVAELLNIEPGYVMACIAAERSRKPEVKAAWKHTAEVLYGLAAALAVVAFLPTVPLPDYDGFNAALIGLAAPVELGTVYYVKSICGYWPVFAIAAALAAWHFYRHRHRNPPR